ncbi:MAG: TldD/PmbA family protein [Nitrosarchaeum sp.]|nr:TldD/PmbA family protein [Nitrosarchaeum sp.]
MSAFDKAISFTKKFLVDECEIIFVKKKITTIRITDSEISEIKQVFNQGFCGRLIQGRKISSFQTNNEKQLENIMEKSLNTHACLKPKCFWKKLPSEDKYPTIKKTRDRKLEDVSGNLSTDIAHEMINSALDEKINTVSGSLNIISEHFEISNSSGLEVSDDGTYIAGLINVESELGETPVSGIGQYGCRMLNGFSPEKIGQDAKKMCIDSINPRKCDDEKYSIIFEPYSVGELLAFVMAPNFHSKVVTERKSCFSNYLQNKIASEEFNLIDDPHVPDGIGSKAFDDEGVKTRITHIVEKGMFKSTFSNLFDSFKDDTESTGNASRATSMMGRGLEAIPFSAPHNMLIKSGDVSEEEMIKETKRGLIIGRLWYTYSINPIVGDFSCTARSGIKMIKNGEITHPVKPVRIIHNLPILLQSISQIGNNPRKVMQWASLPSITPSIRAENIKISPI